VSDNLHATVAITIPSNTPLTFYDVSLTTGGEVATQLGAFTVTTGSPVLSAVNPPTGHQGDAPFDVNLTGLFTHFNTAAGCSPNCSVASFGAGITVGSTTASDATHAVAHNVTIAQGATIGSRNVTVTTGRRRDSLDDRRLQRAGRRSGYSDRSSHQRPGGRHDQRRDYWPVHQLPGGLLDGQLGFGNHREFHLRRHPHAVNRQHFYRPERHGGNRDVSVTTNGTTVTLGGGFSVTPGTPVITQISPNIGNPGQTGLTITITGQYTNWTAASTVTIGTPADGITVVGATGPGLPGPV
jgi:hypothetical protein